MEDILTQIVANKIIEVESQKKLLPLEQMLDSCETQFERKPVSMRKALEQSASGIIAEFKRRSPSKGWLHPKAQVKDILPLYETNGASACSVLTDTEFFGGSLTDLQEARSLVQLPLLRKDFIIDAYQIYQAHANGADAILLIAAILTVDECALLAKLAHELNLEVLLEIHGVEEFTHLNEHVDMLGVNNRHLGTFHTDVAHSFNLVERMEQFAASYVQKPILISESGISNINTVKELRQVGFKGFLIGETFMKTENPGLALDQFIKNVEA